MATTRKDLRPKISERRPKRGCTMALASRYEVPVQNASVAVPFSETAIYYDLDIRTISDKLTREGLTGSTGIRIVPSSGYNIVSHVKEAVYFKLTTITLTINKHPSI
jgi:hypothetical protein